MKNTLLKLLQAAQGQSEFVIAVVVDVRGFSEFSRRNESPNTAMFIKRFYIRLITTYFPSATFVKPTGDGLLMTFPYDETTLSSVSETVITSCFSFLEAFPTLCKDDPMINFEVPQNVGFGIARGTACRLFSGDEVLDYSGHLLNLATRLNDLARPNGIVIDGRFRKELIPEAYRDLFAAQNAFIRGIAEDLPMEVLYLASHVTIPEANLVPIGAEAWKSHLVEHSVATILKLSDKYRVDLPSRAKFGKFRVECSWPKKGVKNVSNIIACTGEYGGGTVDKPYIQLDIGPLKKRLLEHKASRNSAVKISIEYVQEPVPRTPGL